MGKNYKNIFFPPRRSRKNYFLSLDAEAATLKPAVPWHIGRLPKSSGRHRLASWTHRLLFFRNMQRIKINLCAEVAAFFSQHGKNIPCNHWDMVIEFATGIFYLFFIFGSAILKLIKCIFPPGRSWKIYFIKVISGCGSCNIETCSTMEKNY